MTDRFVASDDFCQECNHPQRFHVNHWNLYRGELPRSVPCHAEEGDCGCPEFIPWPDIEGAPV